VPWRPLFEMMYAYGLEPSAAYEGKCPPTESNAVLFEKRLHQHRPSSLQRVRGKLLCVTTLVHRLPCPSYAPIHA